MSDKCGTYAGWNQHRRDGSPTCDACRKAQADYVSGWRRRTNSPKELEAKQVGKARWRAIALLIEAHPEEFARLFAAERKARDVA